MLQMIWDQRDRFKSKIHDLESQNRKLEEDLKTYEIQSSSLKNDNVKLYEKIKYLQSYGAAGGGGAGSSQKSGQRSDSINNEENYKTSTTTDVESKYKAIYEDNVNPFAAFNKKEKLERYKNLNTVEKLILSTTKFFLSTKKTRFVLFVYMFILHALVFTLLWRSVHITY
eukprot:TRINITY_DN3565_c0_g1_i2.p1 TRINITY_DN3565_c0_g1~~TRINITY_DN3565_c0_g1_i2.p1  ORF type:complete len:170 (+),score=44.58 TRINITY_DN3565_c0_g1_i2:219-728(+)